MSDQNDVVQIWKEELEKAGKKILSAKLMGVQLPVEKVQIEVEIPSAITEALKNACKRMELDEKAYLGMIAGMASGGVSRVMEERLGTLQATPAPAPAQPQNSDPTKILDQVAGKGFDLTELTNKMGQIDAMVSRLGGMQEMFKNAEPNTDQNTPDCVKSDVPTR